MAPSFAIDVMMDGRAVSPRDTAVITRGLRLLIID